MSTSFGGYGEMSREELLGALTGFAKNWLAHDGTWFQAAERAHGMETAMALDTEAWRRFSPIEAARIRKLAELGENPGLEGLARALDLRMYALINRQEHAFEGGKLIFTMRECRVQAARRRKGLADFPCRSVGVVEYGEFARAIDPRIETRCLACPPDELAEDEYCSWEFSIER